MDRRSNSDNNWGTSKVRNTVGGRRAAMRVRSGTATVSNGATGPFPSAFSPWQLAQFMRNSIWPVGDERAAGCMPGAHARHAAATTPAMIGWNNFIYPFCAARALP